MKKLFKNILVGLLLSTQVFAVGRLQNEDFKSEAELIAAGTTKARLLNDDKIYVKALSINKTLNSAIVAGDIGGGGSGFNIIQPYNPGFEAGTDSWTSSGGTFTFTSTAANVAFGTQAGDWDSNASAQTLDSFAATIIPGLYSRQGEVSCFFKCASGSCTHTLTANDGTNDITTPTTITSNLTYVPTRLNFTFPASGTLKLRIKSVASNEPQLFIDKCYLGEATNLSQVSQTQFVGSGFFDTTTNCQPSRTNTALGSFTADTDCPGATVESNPGPGSIQTTDFDAFKWTINALPPGIYRVIMSGTGGATGASGGVAYAINDGTTTSGRGSGVSDATQGSNFIAEGWFNYTTSTNRTFELYGSANTGVTNTIYNTNSNHQVRFSIVRFPGSPELAFQPDQTPSSWSGYHDNTCSWARTNTAYGDPTTDASCALVERQNRNFGTVTTNAGTLPGIIFTPKKSGKYFVCSLPKISGGTITAIMDFRLTDGTTVVSEAQEGVGVATTIATIPLCGIINIASTSSTTLTLQSKVTAGSVTIAGSGATNASAVEWTIFPLDQSIAQPYLMGIRSEVTVDSGNGHGSTATKIRRWSNIRNNVGTDITYADSSTAGGTFTINSTGLYCASGHDFRSAGGATNVGITVNDTATTTNINTPITYAQGLRRISSRIEASAISFEWCGILNTSDVVREHTDGTPNATDSLSMFTITRVGL